MAELPRELVCYIIDYADIDVQARCLRLNYSYYTSLPTDLYQRIPLFSPNGRSSLIATPSVSERLTRHRYKQLAQVTQLDVLLHDAVGTTWPLPAVLPALPRLRTVVYFAPQSDSLSAYFAARPTLPALVDRLQPQELFIFSKSEAGWASVEIPPTCVTVGVRIFGQHDLVGYKYGVCNDASTYASMYPSHVVGRVCLSRGLLTYVRRLPTTVSTFRFDHARCRLAYVLKLNHDHLGERMRLHFNPFRPFLLTPIVTTTTSKVFVSTLAEAETAFDSTEQSRSQGFLQVYSVGQPYPEREGHDEALVWKEWLQDDQLHEDSFEVRSTSGHPGSLAAWREEIFESGRSLMDTTGW